MSLSYLKKESIQTKGMQVRVRLCEETVKEYAEAMAAGAKFPPVIVFHDGTNYWLADGFHRLEAWKRNGVNSIKAEVKEGSRIDALKFAFGANNSHGLRMSNEDKRQVVLMVYENRVALGLGDVPSANSVAEMCGVSNHFADKQLGTVPSWKDATERQGADGRKRSLPLPPPRPPMPVPPGARFPMPPPRNEGGNGGAPSDRVGDEDQGFGGEDLSPDITIPSHLTDMLGNPVPPNIAELWMRRTELTELVKLLQKGRLAVAKAQDAGDPLWGNFNFSSVMMHIDNALANVKGAVPHCVCVYCQGIGCKACRTGILPLAQYERLPRELKAVKA
jgi:uncharacterized ParB-like nuclease family protein